MPGPERRVQSLKGHCRQPFCPVTFLNEATRVHPHWDGRDEEANLVGNDLYLVVEEAPGQKHTAPEPFGSALSGWKYAGTQLSNNG